MVAIGRKRDMSYETPFTRRYPGLFVFLLHQSQSMSKPMSRSGRPKMDEAAILVNDTLGQLV